MSEPQPVDDERLEALKTVIDTPEFQALCVNKSDELVSLIRDLIARIEDDAEVIERAMFV